MKNLNPRNVIMCSLSLWFSFLPLQYNNHDLRLRAVVEHPLVGSARSCVGLYDHDVGRDRDADPQRQARARG